MRILLVHRDIISETGGAEKMCCFFANSFAQRRHQVEIAAMEDVEGFAVYPLNPKVEVKNLFDRQIPQLELKPILRYKGIELIEHNKKRLPGEERSRHAKTDDGPRTQEQVGKTSEQGHAKIRSENYRG